MKDANVDFEAKIKTTKNTFLKILSELERNILIIKIISNIKSVVR